MLPGFSIHSCLSPPPILTFSHSSYQPSPFSFLNRLCVHTCCFLLRHSSCSRALKGLFLLFVQIIDQMPSCQRGLPWPYCEAMCSPLSSTLYLGTLYHITMLFVLSPQPYHYLNLLFTLCTLHKT